MGGLGNNLFQISAAYSLSIRDNKKFICDKTDISLSHKPFNHYEKNIFKKIDFNTNLSNYQIFSEYGFNYNEIPKTNNNLKIIGYFQSEKYFKENRKDILELFELPQEIKEKLNMYNPEIYYENEEYGFERETMYIEVVTIREAFSISKILGCKIELDGEDNSISL